MPLVNNAAITALPAAKKTLIKAVAERHGPTLLGEAYPTDADGSPKASLTAAEVAQVVELITREFWRQQIEAEAVQQAAEAAASAARSDHAADPFGA